MDEPNQEDEARRKAERDKLMEAHGCDPHNPAQVEKFQDGLARVAAEKITFHKMLREMRDLQYLQADKDRRDAAKLQQLDIPSQSRPLEVDARQRQAERRPAEEQPEKKPVDFERMVTDPQYRKQVEQEFKREQALMLQRVPNRSNDGRTP